MLESLALVLSGITTVVALLVLYKVRKIHLMAYAANRMTNGIYSESQALFGQLQALDQLKGLISPGLVLPRLRGWAASPDFLLLIAQYARAHEPDTVVECSSGASTVVLADCMRQNGKGHVYSLEHDPEYAAKTTARLKEAGLDAWATVLDAPLEAATSAGGQPWYSLSALPDEAAPIDLLVIDGPPQQISEQARYPAIPMLADRLSADCAVFLDDAERPDERKIVQRWLGASDGWSHEWHDCEKGCAMLKRHAQAREH